MEVFKTLKPGEPGTKRYTRDYGDQLVAVRYRKAKDPNRILTTVELIVDQRDFHPGTTHAPLKKDREDYRYPVNIASEEIALRQSAEAHGGTWDAERNVWLLPHKAIKALNLETRQIKKTNPAS